MLCYTLRPMVVIGGSSDTSQEQMGAFQELPQVRIMIIRKKKVYFLDGPEKLLFNSFVFNAILCESTLYKPFKYGLQPLFQSSFFNDPDLL